MHVTVTLHSKRLGMILASVADDFTVKPGRDAPFRTRGHFAAADSCLARRKGTVRVPLAAISPRGGHPFCLVSDEQSYPVFPSQGNVYPSRGECHFMYRTVGRENGARTHTRTPARCTRALVQMYEHARAHPCQTRTDDGVPLCGRDRACPTR